MIIFRIVSDRPSEVSTLLGDLVPANRVAVSLTAVRPAGLPSQHLVSALAASQILL